MDLPEYKTSRRKKTPGVDAVERWNTRIVPRGLAGRAGAQQYMLDYGKAMGAPKAIALACQADVMGDFQMGQFFWECAAKLEKVTISDIGIARENIVVIAERLAPATRNEYFPANMQPGMIAPMQPSDGAGSREYYITSPNYWGQRKRDGHKWLVFATPSEVFYQSRSTKLKVAPSVLFDSAVMQYALDRGPFIIEGELYYLDAIGGEHKTGAQAATANIEMGKCGVAPDMKYMPFACLYCDGRDLRDDDYAVRIALANEIVMEINQLLNGLLPGVFEVCETFRTESEKRTLVLSQMADHREGEIWFDPGMTYTPGKQRSDRIVRTKYLDTNEYVITGLTPTTAAGRLFGAIEIMDLQGFSVGSIGTGFDRSTQAEIVRRHNANPGTIRVLVCHQGFSENHQLVHARFDGFC